MERKVTVIRIRRGLGSARYCACDNLGNPIRGFNKLSAARKHWEKEIRWGKVELIRELDKFPDMTTTNETLKYLHAILKSYKKK